MTTDKLRIKNGLEPKCSHPRSIRVVKRHVGFAAPQQPHKVVQPSRATSTLKHSSNQKGLRARNEKRNAAAAALSNVSAAIETGVHNGCAEFAGDEESASLLRGLSKAA